MQTRNYLSDKYGYITYTATRKRLTHEAYTGTVNGIKDFCPAIISAKQYKNVQRLIGMNKKEYKPKKPQEEYIFSGMIKCKECGGSFNSNRIFSASIGVSAFKSTLDRRSLSASSFGEAKVNCAVSSAEAFFRFSLFGKEINSPLSS